MGLRIPKRKTKKSYGILIPVFWEKAYRMGILDNSDGSLTFGKSTPDSKDSEPEDGELGDDEAQDDKKPKLSRS